MLQEIAMQPGRPEPRGALYRTTGRDRAGWFAVLDEWGAAGRPYREIASYLRETHGLSSWWAQKLIVEYEQARGIRPPGIRPGGTFEVGASKTVAIGAERVFQLFVDDDARTRLLPEMRLRTLASEPRRLLRFEADDGSRVQVELVERGPGRTLVSVLHGRLPDADRAARTKAYWRERLTALEVTPDS